MKITFLSAGYENLAVEYLSAYLRQEGYKTSLAFDPLLFSDCNMDNPRLASFFSFTPRVIKEVVAQKPDVIAISVITPFYRWALNISKNVKESLDVPIVIGGIHASAVPDRILKNKCIDLVCVGEGEEVLLDVVTAIEGGDENRLKKIPNVYYRDKDDKIHKNKPRPLIENIDRLPFPDKYLFFEKSKTFKNRYLVIASRGCMFNCSYCSNNVWRFVYRETCAWNVRRRSVDNVIDELKEGIDQWHPKIINFVDDAFDMDKKWVEEFAVKYKKEVGVPFTTFAHPKFVDKKLMKLLKEAGLVKCELGVQSLNMDIKRKILNRYETNEETLTAIKTIKEAGVQIAVDHIIGLPHQTENDLKKASSLYNKIKPDILNCYGLQYFPKSEIINTALKTHLIEEKDIEKIEEGYQTGFLLGGDVQNVDMFNNYRILFGVLPIVSYKKGEKLIQSIDEKKFSWSKLTEFSFSLSKLLSKDLAFRIFIKHYSEFLRKFIIGKRQYD